MSEWKKAGKVSEFSEGSQWQVDIEGRPVALFKFAKKFYAIKNSCLHQGWPLSEGNVKNYMVECPLHGWVYDFRDGTCISTPGRKTTVFEVRIVMDEIEIKLDH